MLPIERRQDTEICILLCSSSCTILGKTLVFKIRGIWVTPPSLMYEKAQQMSEIISSVSFSINTLASDGIHLAIFLYWGAGLPLHKFDRVQLAFLVKVLPAGDLSSKLAMGSTALAPMTKSRIFGPSPAKLPRPQIACSITSMWGECNSCTNASIVPFPMRT